MLLPDSLIQTLSPHDEALSIVRADGVRPTKHEFVTRDIKLVGDGFVSPDGVWTAVIGQYVYAPQDILLIKEIP